MKRVLFGILLASALTGRLLAQTDAVAIAAQREAEENMKRLTATLAEVQTAQEQQHTEILALKAEVDRLRSEVAKANNNAATQEALKRLNDQILKVDESRVADNKKLYEAMDKMARLMSERPVLPPPPSARVEPPRSSSNGGTSNIGSTGRSASNTPEEGFEYTVQSGDRLDLIVKRYREEEKLKITMKMVMDANPNVKWERLKIGQKIFIPKPK